MSTTTTTTSGSGSMSAGDGGGTTTGPLWPAPLGFRREEEAALKLALQNAEITVPNANGVTLPVKVWWRDPQREQREVSYPYILLDYLGTVFRRDEEERGVNLITYYQADSANPIPTEPGQIGLTNQYPIPVYLRYQVTVNSRTNVHDVLLEQRLLQPDLFPPRFGQLTCPSGTVRRLDVLGMASPSDGLVSNQRLFRKAWTIQISSELLNQTDVVAAATTVDVSITDL